MQTPSLSQMARVVPLVLVPLLGCAGTAPLTPGEARPQSSTTAAMATEPLEGPSYADWVAFADRVREVGRLVDDDDHGAAIVDAAKQLQGRLEVAPE